MVNTVPTRTPLGASTTNRKWYLDVQDPAAPGVWVGVFGITEFKPKPGIATTQDDGDFDGGGYKSQTVTALEGGAEGKLARKTQSSDAESYDPGQEIIRRNARRLGAGNRLRYRFYEMEPNGPRVEAYEGWGGTTWDEDGGNQEALDTVSFTIFGQGELEEIPHPEGTTASPVIASITPAGQGAGKSVVIIGAHFTGLTGAAAVKFDGVNATEYTVVDDGTLLAVLPAGDAGPVPVIVGGTTAGTLYTRA